MMVLSSDLTLAKWQDRFIAWIVDFVIVSIGIGVVLGTTYRFENIHPGWFAGTSSIFFVYWVFLEYSSGQSLGKRLLHLKTVKLDGTNPTLIDSIVNSFGKAFLLPIDVVLGLIFTDKKRQRVFNRLSNTIVIKTQVPENEEISYKLD